MAENDPVNEHQQYVDRLMDSAARGDVSAILDTLRVSGDINVTNNRGWTVLMFAARYGHVDVVNALVGHGCDIAIVNSLGQTARDIAKFWDHEDVVIALSSSAKPSESTSLCKATNFFCESPLNRMSERRSDGAWLKNLATSDAAVYILFIQLDLLVKPGADQSLRPIRFTYKQLAQYLREDRKTTVVFLGVDESCSADVSRCGWFAADASFLSAEEISALNPLAEKVSIRPLMFQMPRMEASIVGHARSMLAWHDRYQFCPTCGSATEIKEAGYKRVCVKSDCRSNSGVNNTCYPRTDPTVIMAVLSPDRSRILLGRNRRFLIPMYSCLAGFMEPGESIEEACRREVFEESGIRVGRVEYHSCQPWPMPSSLMIGCIGQAESDVITVDKSELEDAQWFTAEDVRLMLSHQHPQNFVCPPSQAIAHQLIKHSLNLLSKL